MRVLKGLRAGFAALPLLACGGGAAGGLDGAASVLPDGSRPDAPPPPVARAPDASTADAPTIDAPDAPPGTLTVVTSFMAPFTTTCGLGYDWLHDQVWVYPCFGDGILGLTTTGTIAGTVSRPGERGDDADVTFAPNTHVGLNNAGAGAMLFIDGDLDVAEIYVAGTSITPPKLVAGFGESHVVGGSYHATRRTFFLVQDTVPRSAPSTIAEIDPTSGAVLNTFVTTPTVRVNYGDVEVCQATGNLFLVSSFEPAITEFTPEGTLVTQYPLPAGVEELSGIGLVGDGTAWVSTRYAGVWQLAGIGCR